MMETPVSRIAGQPRTPFWEFAALLTGLGGLLVLGGDADAEQLTADGTPLYRTVDGERTFVPGGARGWMRLPVFDHEAASPPQLFAQAGRATGTLELAIRGRGPGGYRQYLRTSRQAFLVESPSKKGTLDTFRVIRMDGLHARVEAETTGAKTASIGLGSLVNPGRGESLGAIVKLGLAGGATAFAETAADGVGLRLRSAGHAQPVEVQFERSVGGVTQRVAITVPAGAAGESLRVRPSDAVSPLGEMQVQRLSAGGEPVGGPVLRLQPRVLDGASPGLVDLRGS
jgi:hypothetical protein